MQFYANQDKEGGNMGDRASISFKQGGYESVILCNHWGGRKFQEAANEYTKELIAEKEGKYSNPLDRLEPSTVMVDFIRHITKGMERVDSDLYLGKDESEVDNSDKGNYIIELPEK